MRERCWKLLVALPCIAALLGSPGCFGKSAVTSSVIKWHAGIQLDKYSKEAIYLPIFFFVLPITSFVDAFIVNPIYYWQNDDPLTARALGIPPGTDPARLKWETLDTPGGPVKIALLAEPDGNGKAPRIVAAPGEARVEDIDGRTVLVARAHPDGSVTVQDLVKGTERIWPPAEVAAAVRP